MPLGDPPPLQTRRFGIWVLRCIFEGPGSGETALSDVVSLETEIDGRVDLLEWSNT